MLTWHHPIQFLMYLFQYMSCLVERCVEIWYCHYTVYVLQQTKTKFNLDIPH
jgi:hypothetical protein